MKGLQSSIKKDYCHCGIIGFVGCISFYEEKHSYGFFYQIKEKYWGKGIGKEAAKWMLGHRKKVEKKEQ